MSRPDGSEQSKVSISALMNLITEMPETPRLFTMPIEIIKSSVLPENYILVSSSVADALDEAMKANNENPHT